MTRRLVHSRTRQTIAAISAALLLAVWSIVAGATRADAATYSAFDEESWFAAIANAASNAGADVIEVSGDFALNGEYPEEIYDADDDLTINGNGHTITAAAGNVANGFTANDDGPIGGEIVISDLGFDAFDDYLAILVYTTRDVTLSNVTVTNHEGEGSAVYLGSSEATVEDSHFSNNHALGADGGALYLDPDESAVIRDSTFSGNTAFQNGGAVYADNDLEIYNSDFTDNAATEGDGGAVFAYYDLHLEGGTYARNEADGVEAQGGAVWVDDDTYISGADFTDNRASDDGGAVFGAEYVEIYETTFADNYAGDDGGAVYVVDDAYLELVSFDGNEAGEDGGALHVENDLAADLAVEVGSSSFTDNAAGDDGGAIYIYEANAYVWHSLFTGNAARDLPDTETDANEGGAVYMSWGGVELENNTFIDNVAEELGGAVSAEFGAAAYYSVFRSNESAVGAHVWIDDASENFATSGSVFDDALSGEGCAFDLGTAVESEGYSYDADGTCTNDLSGEGDVDSNDGDLLFAALADNGGPTMTLKPQAGSLLIDAIPADFCTSDTESLGDYDHDARDFPRPAGDGCDMGSVEVLAPLHFTIDIDTPSGPDAVDVTVEGATSYDCDASYSLAELGGTPPSGVSFPFGGFGYCFEVPFDGAAVDITLELPSPVNELWKVSDSGIWTEVTTASFVGATVKYSVTDGGTYDQDGAEDGVIIDPVAPGVGAAFTG